MSETPKANGTTEIRVGQEVATLVNTFSVDPERQDEFVRAWVEHTEKTMRHRPGFISANLHASVDGERVMNYAQWRSQADLQAALADPEVAREIVELGKFATGRDPRFYRVVSVHTA
ncbi:antibiotic biosynthesis monooxygenase family protein [Nocardia camponoti]|uniref:Antibiotic biosynthesis monooxygenase n=1 Tax=Nocardia camponoti TaxID=1616106 RepID=A0A917QS14_9NOCA|nr:antibiotic biosynthesis monooxygenase family protein [Nocardia camponoti]GGK64842.1 antibiotic biosynthesis monooxygenase [Nocardia camponoti]